MRNKLMKTGVAAIAVAGWLAASGVTAASASAAQDAAPPITIANIVSVRLLPPSPCRPSEAGGARCLDIGSVAQISLLPPSPCAGIIACR